jgi:branched-subunit amino acid transport protein
MNTALLIAAMTAGLLLLRVSGLLLRDRPLPPSIERGLSFMPVAMLSAFMATTLTPQASADPIRWVAAGGAALIVARTRRLWACILGGMALYWTLRLLTG